MAYSDYNDLSGVSGGPVVIGDYTASVFLHDASGFYNWQQDNIPIADLQERDNFLFKMLGSPTSAVEGVTFVLSSTAGDPSSNIFADIEDITSRIPKRLTYPLLVELCAYGSLSGLNLNGITTEGAGALRVVNRNVGYTPLAWTENPVQAPYYDNINHYVASGSIDDGGWDSIINASSHHLSIASYDDTEWKKYARGYFMKAPHNAQDEATDFVSLEIRDSVAHAGVDFIYDTSHARHASNYSVSSDLSISGYDPHPRTQNGRGSELFLGTDDPTSGVSIRKSVNTGTGSGSKFDWGIYYGSYFTQVKLESCEGDIVLENICVDGASGIGSTLEHNTTEGFQIRNSTVKLKNCTSLRNSQAGFCFRNSNVNIQESICAARNYAASNVDRFHIATKDLYLVGAEQQESAGYGIKALNSYVLFESASGLTYSGNYPKILFGNGVGLFSLNSCIKGGSFDVNNGYGSMETQHLQAIYNNYNGIELRDSELTWVGAVDCARNGYNGAYLKNSILTSHIFAVEDNQKSGIYADNSDVKYGFRNIKVNRVSTDPLKRGQFSITNNGQNLTLVSKSTFKPFLPEQYKDYNDSFLTSQFGEWTASSSHHGCPVENSLALSSVDETLFKHSLLTGAMPGILVKDNSTAEIFNLDYMAPALRKTNGTLDVSSAYAYVAIYGHCALARDNSEITLRGLNDTDQVTTLTTEFYGDESAISTDVTSVDAQHHLNGSWTKSAVCAKNNSKIKITGPTKITRLGIGLHAEDYSVIEIIPPEYPFGDGSMIDMAYSNASAGPSHTKLEIHSTRSCIVVNNNSLLKCEFIGNPISREPNLGYNLDSAGDRGYNIGDQLAVSGGYIKLYPNGFTQNAISQTHFLALTASSVGNNTPEIGTETELGEHSTGGMCIRAVGNSLVKMNEVNFKPSVTTDSVSGAFYDLLAGTCERPHLWNIADQSKIECTRLTLSGVDGSAHDYHGPSGLWMDQNNFDAGSNYEQMFLDDFGEDGRIASGTPGTNDASNVGYFRLMVGTPGFTDALIPSGEGGNLQRSVIGQLISQGYSPSSSWGQFVDNPENITYMISSGAAGDDSYPASAAGGVLVASSFAFNPGSIAANFLDKTAKNRNYMDIESSRLFANAKHISQPHLGQLSFIGLGNRSYSDELDVTFTGNGVGVRSLNRFDLKRLT